MASNSSIARIPGLVVAVTMILTGGLGWSAAAANEDRHPEAVLVPVADGTMDECELHCWEGPCDSGEHDAFDSLLQEEWDAIRNGGAHLSSPLCRTGSCDTKHGPLPCEPVVDLPQGQVDLLETLRVAIRDGDPQTVAEIVKYAPDRAILNLERSAVQVTGCRGGMVAHMPLADRFLALVEQARTENDKRGSPSIAHGH